VLWVTNKGQTETLDDLRVWLNANGFTSDWGNPYWTSRGVARAVSCAHAYVKNELGLGDAGAEPIAKAFTNQHGAYAWDY
jgi:hypothetical protein